jgi:hypothetical protein
MVSAYVRVLISPTMGTVSFVQSSAMLWDVLVMIEMTLIDACSVLMLNGRLLMRMGNATARIQRMRGQTQREFVIIVICRTVLLVVLIILSYVADVRRQLC